MLFLERNNQDTPTIVSIQNRIMHSCLVSVYVQNMLNQRTEGGLLNFNIWHLVWVSDCWSESEHHGESCLRPSQGRMQQLMSLVRDFKRSQKNFKSAILPSRKKAIQHNCQHFQVWMSRQVTPRADLKMLREVSKTSKISSSRLMQLLM